MDPDLQTRLAAQDGVVSLADLAELGISAKTAGRLVRTGTLIRLRRSCFVDPQRWTDAASWRRQELTARAVGRAKATTGSPYALSHHSALTILGIAVHGVDERAHLVRTDGRRGNTCPVSWVHAPVPADQVRTMHGIQIVRPEFATIQVARTFGVEAGLVSADSGLRDEHFTRSELTAVLDLPAGSAGRRAARIVVQEADPSRESAGESRCWWLLRTLGLPPPQQQAWIRDPVDGSAVGRVDFLFADQRTVIEFDGMAKYGNERSLRDEKHREDRIRELGYEVVRLIWADLDRPDHVLGKIRAAFHRAAKRNLD